MAKNCSTDVSRVIDYLDFVLTFGSKSEVNDLKAKFGLEGVEHNDDFAVYVYDEWDLFSTVTNQI